MTREIPLSGAKYADLVAIVDDDDYERLSKRRWFYKVGYAARKELQPDGTRKWVSMHRLILGATRSDEVDHCNRNRLDNRKSNLRIVTRQQNTINASVRSDNTSGYKGVHYDRSGRWRAQININGKRTQLGSFRTAIEAARVYNAKAKELHGEFAHLNDIP